MSFTIGPAADGMRPEALPQLDARSFIDGERLAAEVKKLSRPGQQN